MLKSKKFLMSEKFLGNIDRAEFSHNPVVYSKAIRATLIALGYDEEFINIEFREKLENSYDFYFNKRFRDEFDN